MDFVKGIVKKYYRSYNRTLKDGSKKTYQTEQVQITVSKTDNIFEDKEEVFVLSSNQKEQLEEIDEMQSALELFNTILTEENDKLTEDCASLSEDNEKLSQDCASLSEDNEKLANDYAALSEELNNLKDELNNNESKLEDYSANLDESKSELEESNKKLIDLKEDCSSLRKEIEENEILISNLRSQIEENEGIISSLRDKIGENEGIISSLRDKIGENESTISNLGNQINENESIISNLGNQIEENETIISNLNKQLDDKNFIINDLNENLDSLYEKLNSEDVESSNSDDLEPLDLELASNGSDSNDNSNHEFITNKEFTSSSASYSFDDYVKLQKEYISLLKKYERSQEDLYNEKVKVIHYKNLLDKFKNFIFRLQ